jgi:crotonobetainyl-CoA:carnitine CoA-transferase CaiB-like acyl-CoA transferase
MLKSTPCLAGIKVIDLGTMVTAPLAAMMLAQLGADVVKVEHPAGGDPFRNTTGGTYSPNYIAYNQNKKSIQLDLNDTAERGELLGLIGQADILIENFRAGVMDKLGLSQAELARCNRRLIHCSITGFGPDGPYAKRPAYDTVGTALAGILHLYLDPDHPEVLGPTLADNVTGMLAANGVLAALHARNTTNQGQRVEVNMLEAAISLIPDAFAYQTQLAVAHGPLSRASSSQCFALRCSDGRAIAIHLSVQEKFWWALLDAVGARGSIGEDDRFRTRRLRLENYRVLSKVLGEIVGTKSSEFWSEALTKADVPFAPINSIAEVLDDPQVKHLGTFANTEHPVYGKITGIRSPIRINGRRNGVVAPPALGEHTEVIRRSLLRTDHKERREPKLDR